MLETEGQLVIVSRLSRRKPGFDSPWGHQFSYQGDRICRRGLWRPWVAKVMAWFMPSR